MWADLEGHKASTESGNWQEMIQSAISGVIVCVLFLVAFVAFSAPRIT